MKERSRRCWWLIGMIATALCVYGVRAQNADGPNTAAAPGTSAPAPSVAASTNSTLPAPAAQSTEVKPDPKSRYSPGVDEVLRMLHAGVSPQVIRSYIENSPTHYALTPQELIALKKEGVPDELVSAMVQRGGALAAQAAQAATPRTVLVPSSAPRQMYGGLDPDSYEYFQYYYLYPRTLAEANQRLYTPYPSFQGFGAYPYGFYGAMPFNPLPPSALNQR
jgi:hypothetical protein